MIDYQITESGVAVLTWNLKDRPVNVMNDDSLALFGRLVEQAVADPAVKGLVVTSAKRDFITGADLVSFLSDRRPAVILEKTRSTQALLRRLESAGKPVCAAINGSALGGGLEIALACHQRIAADNAGTRLGLPEVTLGLLPGAGGTQRLPRLLGLRRALPLLLHGTLLSVTEAHTLGLIDAVVPPDQLLECACARVLAAKAPCVQPWDQKGFELPGGLPNPVGVYEIFALEAAHIAGRTQNRLPAQRHVLSSVFEGYPTDIDTGLKAESRHFVSCVGSTASQNIIRTAFFGIAGAVKLKHRPTGIPTLAVRSIGLVGSGDAATALVKVAVAAKLPVRWLAGDGAADVDGVELVATLDDLNPSDFVFITEGSTLSSYTMQYPSVRLPAATASATSEGLGWLMAPRSARGQLVELQRGLGISETLVAHAMDVARRLGLVPLVVDGSKGGYFRRVLEAYRAEGQRMLAEGVAPVVIDNAARQSGMAESPIDLRKTAEEAVAASNLAVTPPDWQATGRTARRLAQRLLYVQSLEALRCLEEGVVATPLDADIGALLGCGFPEDLGGPIGQIDTVGAADFATESQALARELGQRFTPPQFLVGRQSQRFYDA
jgi:3-hydroxyacyl-CoA dehydrogenase / enoyl-CoA hydratase / 3-hydroxybutyryl-CoA epimerase